MPLTRSDLVASLVTARDLLGRPSLDVQATLDLLNALPADLGNEARASVDEALRLVAGSVEGGAREAVARYALARVIVLLERVGAEHVS